MRRAAFLKSWKGSGSAILPWRLISRVGLVKVTCQPVALPLPGDLPTLSAAAETCAQLDGRGDRLHHALARLHEHRRRLRQRVGRCDRFNGEAAAAAAVVFAADAARPHALHAQGQVGQVAQVVAEEGDGKGEGIAGCVACPVVERRTDGVGPPQVAAGILLLRHGQQLADGTDRRVQHIRLLAGGSVASLRTEGAAQDAGKRPPHRAAFEGVPEDRLLRAAVEGEMVDGKGGVQLHATLSLNSGAKWEQRDFGSCLFRAYPSRSGRVVLQWAAEVIVVFYRDTAMRYARRWAKVLS